ncbi:Oxysterol-binding protein [Sesbania bispinosa]|nr:Oxysterol-binding protein [Sesbania bispinosa]
MRIFKEYKNSYPKSCKNRDPLERRQRREDRRRWKACDAATKGETLSVGGGEVCVLKREEQLRVRVCVLKRERREGNMYFR